VNARVKIDHRSASLTTITKPDRQNLLQFTKSTWRYRVPIPYTNATLLLNKKGAGGLIQTKRGILFAEYVRIIAMVKIVLEVVTLVAIGWLSGAEIGSWFGIQPIVSKLPYEQQMELEQSMLKTYGKIMPILMPFGAVMVILLAIYSRNDPGIVMWLRTAAAIFIAITIVTTLTINVPINNLTADWKITDPLEKWTKLRTRWHLFQGIRGGLFLASFIMLAIAGTLHRI
jgi:uncharacterized membrane protein